jgi:type I restriction enzyme S subunit
MKIQKALHRVRLFDGSLLNTFVLSFLKYSSQTGHLERYFTGTTIKHLTGAGLANFAIPLCPYEEQHAIVAEIEARLSVVDKLEETIATSLQQAEALRQSILKQAFAGKLVPQDSNDEPAEKLLARIKQGISWSLAFSPGVLKKRSLLGKVKVARPH